MADGIPKVALLVETALGYGRGFLRGVMRYARLHGPWAFYIMPGDLHQVLPKMEEWGGTGIIARIETPEVAAAILATKLPVIALDLSRQQLAADNPLSRISEVCPNSHRAGEMAADHLLEKGLRQFAFVGAWGDPLWSARREEGFVARLAEAGFTGHVYPLPQTPAEQRWGREQAVLSQWLRELPTPIGILACDDDRGRQALEACRLAGVQVPEDVAVVGVDNDELLCELSDPPLSSVALNTERGGFEAAELLDGLMAGRLHGPERILVEPTRVVTRQSSDVVALEDRRVGMALRFIHTNAARPIGVLDVAAHVECSRRTLELCFRQTVKRSVNEEIQRVRLEKVKQLLMETDLNLGRIAEVAGFASANYMIRLFHRATGETPVAYRANQRRT